MHYQHFQQNDFIVNFVFTYGQSMVSEWQDFHCVAAKECEEKLHKNTYMHIVLKYTEFKDVKVDKSVAVNLRTYIAAQNISK